MTKQPRHVLVLGKFRVSRVQKTPTGYQMAIELPSLGKMICHVPVHADVKEGDLLTLYTEVLANAKP